MAANYESSSITVLCDHFVTGAPQAEWVAAGVDGLFNVSSITMNLPIVSISDTVDKIQMADELKNGSGMDKVNTALELARCTGDVTHLLHAYTVESIFYRVLNRTLANQLPSTDLTELISMFNALKNGTHKKATLNWALCYASTIRHACISPESSLKYYFGKTYRGINVTEQDLLVYHVNSFIIQKTFASTSKDRSVAECFVVSSGPGQIPAICTYVLDDPDMKFFIDIGDMGAIRGEEEVLILPFSMFMISKIDRTKNNNFIEIELTVPTTTRIESLDLNDWEPSDNMINWAMNLIDIPTLMAGIDIDDMTSD
ncbi:unnamed protein product [Adineta steineri]|uniref:NAD(P)(+)--arginine ADP-ribosyltransferase n=1 Tax=Adineta steineri TaxID=433720 RepID=A0A813XQ25_9BILA|nr:unnamed protein product [Adineta steineri]CAF1620975.1 unnamed protein product [Adineta steineri]